MADRLDILVLHALGDLARARRTSVNHLTCLSRYQPGHRYLYHDVADPVTEALRAIRFHAVVLDVTFLCMRFHRPRSRFEQIVAAYDFVARADSVRVALAQDDCDHSQVLDEWLSSWSVDLVFTALPHWWGFLYPETSRRAVMEPALTGYVDDHDLGRVERHAKPYARRSIDVGYRARDLPPQFGRYGMMKSGLGRRFEAEAAGRGLRLDVSTRPEDVFAGDSWLGFLGDCRHTLGCEGGSSVHDPQGLVRDRVEAFLKQHPDAPFEEVEAACFPGLDGRHVFSAISPRLFEAAMTRTDQILVRAPYLPEIRPDEHYLVLEKDFSNAREVLEALDDPAGSERRAERCGEALFGAAKYRYSQHARHVIGLIGRAVQDRSIRGMAPGGFEALARRHAAEVRWSRLRSRAHQWSLRAALPLRHLIPRAARRSVYDRIWRRGR